MTKPSLKSALTVTFSHTTRTESPPTLGGTRESAVWTGIFDDQFVSTWAPFGGYVLALALHVTKEEVKRRGLVGKYPEPVSMTTSLMEGGRVDAPYLAIVTPVRLGGRFAVFDVTFRQESAKKKGVWGTLFNAKVTMADLAGEKGYSAILSNDGRSKVDYPFAPPALSLVPSDSSSSPSSRLTGLGLPPRNTCVLRTDFDSANFLRSPRTGHNFVEVIETLDEPHDPLSLPDIEKGTEWRKWVRWKDNGDVQDTVALAFWADLWHSPVGWGMRKGKDDGQAQGPTLEFQIQIRAIPDPTLEWILIASRSLFATNGAKREWDVEIWDERGVLLSVARQLSVSSPRTQRKIDSQGKNKSTI
ncbi:hypothetical protein M427DRAFT_55447 [Gonapodya prolifera JEL478]|uniref:Thioesterase family protein n=1 Tax=Gonapodya prolifera (strain JEL478) TaxID=1344416 RepID=A0A139AIV3_GONPJ|nr:hypothetical protein M427DRAFT_55447 [Gonapodya prolifera JEL478]|eukprot:KXS16494.1 hypothetical protein M427DRAFT_55447 [Gonapodya prolifera JEL478]